MPQKIPQHFDPFRDNINYIINPVNFRFLVQTPVITAGTILFDAEIHHENKACLVSEKKIPDLAVLRTCMQPVRRRRRGGCILLT